MKAPDKLDKDFLIAIQTEYATRYLEIMDIEPSQKNREALLSQQPLTACQLDPGWNNSGWLADSINIYPNRLKRKTYENTREEYLEQRKRDEKAIKEQEEANKFSWEFKD